MAYVEDATHARMLLRFDVRADYASTDHEEATEGETRP